MKPCARAVFWAGLLCWHVALADPAVPLDSGWLETRVSLSGELWAAPDATVGAVSAVAQLRVHRLIALVFGSPFVAGTVRNDRTVSAAAGNELLGFHIGGIPWPHLSGLSVGTGLLVELPTNYSTPRTEADFNRASLLTLAAVADDFPGLDRFFPFTAFVRVPASLEDRPARWLVLRFEVSVLLWIPTGAAQTQPLGTKAIPLLSLESWGEVEFRTPPGVVFGVRLQWAAIGAPTLSYAFNSPTVAGEVFVGYEPVARGFFGRFGVLASWIPPLTQPYSADRPIVERLTVGYRF